MKIDINKDFEEAFPDEFYAGFTLKQCVFAAIGLCFTAAVAVFLWHFTGMGIVECTYAAVPIMIPVVGIGIFEYQKQTPIQMLKEMRYVRKTKHLFYEAEEKTDGLERVFSMKRLPAKRKRGGRRKHVSH